MGQLAIIGAIVVASVAISFLMPMPKVKQEGPRLNDLDVTSATYGRFINILFGTDRLPGNLIECTTPAIEQVTSTETERVGKGGGAKVTSTNYENFFTGTIAFCQGGPCVLLRLWADGKIIVDNTAGAGGQQVKDGVVYRFYPGGPNQMPDPEENERRGGLAPAYRHLARIKFDRLPLADFGNRIPNFTAEISFNGAFGARSESDQLPDTEFSDAAALGLDPYRRIVIRLPYRTGSAGNQWAMTADLNYLNRAGLRAFSSTAMDWQGRTYGGNGSGNSTALRCYDAMTGNQLWTCGRASNNVAEFKSGGIINFLNSNHWMALTCLNTPYGAQSIVMHYGSNLASSFSLIYADGVPLGVNPTDGISADSALWNAVLIAEDDTTQFPGGTDAFSAVIPDHDRGYFYCIMAKATVFEVWRISFTFQRWIFPELEKTIKATHAMTLVGTLSRTQPGDDFPGSGGISGWAVNRVTGDLILSNGSTVLLYSPTDNEVLATTDQLPGFYTPMNYFSGTTMGYIRVAVNDNRAIWFDARTLEKLQEVTDATEPLLANDVVDSYVWDDHDQAIIATHPDQAPRLRKFFLGRVSADGVPLPDVVEALCCEYLDLPMGGLDPDDLNLADLVGHTVWGYTINNRSRLRDALDPLQTRYLFDTIQSDWKLKCVERGGAVVEQIPSRLIGELKKSPDGAEPAVRETRVQDKELPMSVNVKYRDREHDYQTGLERDKRQRAPIRTMESLDDLTIELPLCDTATPIKQLASKILFTTWRERRRVQTILPWQYLALDPADVIEINVFDETLRVRIDKLDTGANFFLDATMAVEDSRTYDSSIEAGENGGYIPQPIPSRMPPTLLLLDLPSLLPSDSSPDGTVSSAYVAMVPQGDGWVGGSVFRSQDGTTFQPVATTPAETIMATLQSPPGAWGYNEDGDFPNHFQEAADGGALIISPFRHDDAWSSVTEIELLNGANAIAMITPAGTEVLQFQTVTPNANGTYTLSRLLRGRLGTEDIANAGAAVSGNRIALLAGADGVPYAQSVIPTRLPVAMVGVPLLYRAVAAGAQLESAQAVSFTYQGRDIRPYSPVHVEYAYDDGADELDVVWERRVRGPGQGDWLDGTGEVPLGETIERYRVTLYDSAGAQVATEDIDGDQAITLAGITALPSGGDARIEVQQLSAAGLASPPGTRPL